MGSLTGIIILTAALKPLITTPFRPPSLLPLYTDVFTSARTLAGKQPDRAHDSVLWIGDGLGSLVWISRGGLFFLCGVGKECESLVVPASSSPRAA